MRDAAFSSRFNAGLLAIKRDDTNVRWHQGADGGATLGHLGLQAGDTLLLNARADFWTNKEAQANFRWAQGLGGRTGRQGEADAVGAARESGSTCLSPGPTLSRPPVPHSHIGKAGTVKSSHEFLLPMVVTGRGGKVMLAGMRPGGGAVVPAGRPQRVSAAASHPAASALPHALTLEPTPYPPRRQDAGGCGAAPDAGRVPGVA